MNKKTRHILGVKVDFGLTMPQVLSQLEKLLFSSNTHLVSTTNPEFVIEANKDPEFMEIINSAALSLPDGIGLLQAQKYLERIGTFDRDILYPLRCFLWGCWVGVGSLLGLVPLGERITGVELVDAICRLSVKKGYTICLLGGWPKDFWGRSLLQSTNVAQQAAEVLMKQYSGLRVICATSEFSFLAKDDVPTRNCIKECMQQHSVSHIDFLFIAYGHSRQEGWIVRNSLHIPAKVSVGVGGTFDYIAGVKKRAPRLASVNKLEWFFRLFMQPWRFGRIFTAFPYFPLKVFLDSLKNP